MPTTEVKRRRGTTAEIDTATAAVAEIVHDYEANEIGSGNGGTPRRALMAGLLSKSVAGGSNVTLTNAETSNPVIELTGAITANITVTFTNRNGRFWLVRNKTTGDFTITLKFSSGTGVRILRNQAIIVYRDGTNMVLGKTEDELWSGVRSDLKGAVVFDGVTSNAKLSATLTNQSIGTGDFAISARIKVPTAAGVAAMGIAGLSASATTLAGNNAHLAISTSGTLRFTLYGSTTSDFRYAEVASFVSDWGNKVVDIVAVRNSAGSVAIYVNGVAQTTNESTGGTPPDWTGSVTSTYLTVSIRSAAELFTGEIYRVSAFNCLLSQADVDDMTRGEIPDRLKFGSQTARYTSDFSAGTDSWTAVRATATGNQDSISGQDDALIVYADATSAASHYANRTNAFPASGKRYRVTAQVYVPSGQTAVTRARLTYADSAGNQTTIGTDVSTTGSWQSFNAEVTATSLTNGRLDFMLLAGAAVTFTGANSASDDRAYLKSVVITQLGAFVDLDFGAGIGYQIPDRSSNGLHGVVTTTGFSHKLPVRRGQLRFQTNTNGNQQALGQACLPTNARITYIQASVTGTPTVAVGNVSGGAQIVASGALASGRNELTLLTRFSTTGNIWVSSNGTEVITWTVGYELVD